MTVLAPRIMRLRQEKDLAATFMTKHPKRRRGFDEDYMMEMTSGLCVGQYSPTSSCYDSPSSTPVYTSGFIPTMSQPSPTDYCPANLSAYTAAYSPHGDSPYPSPFWDDDDDAESDVESLCSSQRTLSDYSPPASPSLPSTISLAREDLSNKSALDQLINAHFTMHSASNPNRRISSGSASSTSSLTPLQTSFPMQGSSPYIENTRTKYVYPPVPSPTQMTEINKSMFSPKTSGAFGAYLDYDDDAPESFFLESLYQTHMSL